MSLVHIDKYMSLFVDMCIHYESVALWELQTILSSSEKKQVTNNKVDALYS